MLHPRSRLNMKLLSYWPLKMILPRETGWQGVPRQGVAIGDTGTQGSTIDLLFLFSFLHPCQKTRKGLKKKFVVLLGLLGGSREMESGGGGGRDFWLHMTLNMATAAVELRSILLYHQDWLKEQQSLLRHCEERKREGWVKNKYKEWKECRKGWFVCLLVWAAGGRGNKRGVKVERRQRLMDNEVIGVQAKRMFFCFFFYIKFALFLIIN